MANFISIFRIFVMFYAVYLIYTCQGNTSAYLWALILTIIAFALDGVDGYVARKLHEESKFGALLDIMGDRIVENTYWILFAVMGWKRFCNRYDKKCCYGTRFNPFWHAG